MSYAIEDFSNVCSSFQTLAAKKPSKETTVFLLYTRGEINVVPLTADTVKKIKADKGALLSRKFIKPFYADIVKISRDVESIEPKDIPKMLLMVHSNMEAIKKLKKYVSEDTKKELSKLNDNLDSLYMQLQSLVKSGLELPKKVDTTKILGKELVKLLEKREKILDEINTVDKVNELKECLKKIKTYS
jgi:hypothetical protein